MLEEPKDHAVIGGRDENLHYEGGHNPEYHTVVLGNTDEQQKQRLLQTRPHKQHRRNHSQRASGENQRRNHSQRACGEKNEVKQHGYEDRAGRTSKIWSNDEKNREEQSQQQAEEQSQQQAEEQSQQQARQEQSQRQAREERSQQQASEPKDCDRDKAKYEEKHTTEESCSKQVAKHPRKNADIQQGSTR